MSSLAVLIIEDEAKVAGALRDAFARHRISATLASTGEAGLHLLAHGRIDLVILDLGLPDQPGADVLRTIRQHDASLPVLILTARDSIGDRVSGLQAGADDYLIKPFSFNELLARVRAILRRGSAAKTTMHVADLAVDLLRRTVTRAGTDIDLTPTEFSLLSLLMTNTGDPVPRSVLAEQIWDMHIDSETNVVDVSIRRLRKKVDDPWERKLIHTIRGIGYMCGDQKDPNP